MFLENIRQFVGATDTSTLVLLALAFLTACGFEFVNGFHDTANAVATVIYTKSLKPWQAVTLSGVCNFLGVFLGGTAVAMGVIKLLPVELLVSHSVAVSLAMVFALLVAAILWNLGTWFVGLPASSSHTLIGAILGIGLANAWHSGAGWESGVNWGKAREIGLALLISPLVGFVLSGGLTVAARKLFKNPEFHRPPAGDVPPPWRVRATLMATSSGVSLAHGSNDGQKGVGLIMLVLIALLPVQFSVRPGSTAADHLAARAAAQAIYDKLGGAELPLRRTLAHPSDTAAPPHPASATFVPVRSAALMEVLTRLDHLSGRPILLPADAFEVRSQILLVDQRLSKLEKDPALQGADWGAIRAERAKLRALTDYAPSWVILAVALSIGMGTMIGWKRIVVTIGEKIGKNHLTYAQGASAELVAVGTIGLSAFAGLPVSTTHVLSSGIAGTMIASRSGLQLKTVRNIALAWVLTLPAAMALSAALFLVFLRVFGT